MEECRFCEIFAEGSQTLFDSRCLFVIFDEYPVNDGHLLIITKRHVGSIFDLHANEWEDIPLALDRSKRFLGERFHPDGFNIGVNCGEAAGQTIPHVHIHVIPRYQGDVPNPRGGVRNIKKPLKEW